MIVVLMLQLFLQLSSRKKMKKTSGFALHGGLLTLALVSLVGCSSVTSSRVYASPDEVLSKLDASAFDCAAQNYPGYYADISTDCHGFHVCQKDGRHDVFVCPNNTAFHQSHLVCDWVDNVNCANSATYFEVNAGLFVGGRIIPEPPENIAELLQPHMQPHLKQVLLDSPNFSVFGSKQAFSSQIKDDAKASDYTRGASSTRNSVILSTTESVLDYLGDSLSEMAITGSPFSSLMITPWSNHPSW
ncbi:Chitin binding domain [Trinorchestia longiramus]|nr:Chitin binding domain [Trinorchestia longiramus]